MLHIIYLYILSFFYYWLGKQKIDNVQYRNIRLSGKTYKRLNEYLIDLIKETEDSQLSFDDAVSSLLDKCNRL